MGILDLLVGRKFAPMLGLDITGADVDEPGLAWSDGDADRLQMVDAEGRLFNGDELLYVMVADRLSQQRPAPLARKAMSSRSAR